MSKLTFFSAKDLVADMQKKAVEKEHFSFSYAGHTIDCIFASAERHYELMVAVHNLNYGFVVDIIENKSGEFIGEITENDYFSFCRKMNLSFSNDGFTSNTLLKLLSSHLPSISKGMKLDYSELREYIKCRPVDEADKKFFCGWNDHMKDKRNAQNFGKTEFYLGTKIANYCRANNISSLWSNIPRDERKVTDPWDK